GIFIIAIKATTDLFLPIVGGATFLIICAVVAISYRKLNIAAWLLFLFPAMAAVAGLKGWGYMSTGGTILCYFSVLFGAIVLPKKVLPFLPFGMVIIFGYMAFHVGPNGPTVTPLDGAAPGPMSQTIEITILSSILFGLGYYLLNEFETRRNQL